MFYHINLILRQLSFEEFTTLYEQLQTIQASNEHPYRMLAISSWRSLQYRLPIAKVHIGYIILRECFT